MKFNAALFFGMVFILVIALLWFTFSPILGPVLFGGIFAGVFFPVTAWMQKRWKLSRNMSTWLTCALMVLVVIVPVTVMGVGLSKEVITLYQKIDQGLQNQDMHELLFGDGLIGATLKQVGQLIGTEIDLVEIKTAFAEFIKTGSGSIIKNVNSLVGNVFGFVFDLLIMTLVVFGILMKGESFKEYIFELSPLPTKEEEKILATFNQMNYVTLVCNGIGGVIQGSLAGLAMWAVGIESILLWTSIMIVLAFIPLVGISVVTFPASIFLMATGETGKGVGLLIFSIIVGLVVENWFKPKFIGDRIKIDSIFVLLTIIGGMGAFGMAGIFYGPIIGIMFLTIVDIYHANYRQD